MSETTNIEWCDSTFNPWIGCTKVSPACDHCYAERSTPARTMAIEWGPRGERRHTSPANWALPKRWNAQAAHFQAEHGRRQRVFCASLADVFDNKVDPAWRDNLFSLIANTPNLDWLLLTKRIGNVGNMLPVPFDFDRLYPNVWLGATLCNQDELDRDLGKLLAVPAAKRFLSVEPMLGPLDFTGMFANQGDMRDGTNALEALDWVICGGESGPGARPMHPDWARGLRDQCAAAGVPFLFKQHGEWIGVDDLRRLPGGGMPGFGAYDSCRFDMAHEAVRVGKKAAGRRLDGATHDGFPS